MNIYKRHKNKTSERLNRFETKLSTAIERINVKFHDDPKDYKVSLFLRSHLFGIKMFSGCYPIAVENTVIGNESCVVTQKISFTPIYI